MGRGVLAQCGCEAHSGAGRRMGLDADSAAVLRAAGLLAMLAAPFAARYAVYGDLLPTTYYAKTDRTLRSGIGFLFGAAHGLGPFIWFFALAGLWKLRTSQGLLLVVTGL